MHNTIPDIYFDDNYGSLYEKIENGSKEIFTYQSEHGEIRSQFIKRMIPIQIDDKQYYDIVTPYGYGGPIISKCEGNKEELLKGFENAFGEYCRDNRIVSEFIRFHPIVKNALDFKNIYEIKLDRHTIATDLLHYSIEEEFGKSVKKNLKRALKAGVTYEVIENPTDISEFKKIYYSTMDRNDAEEYYYFSDEYFSDCLGKFRNHIIYVKAVFEGNIIAAGFYFYYQDILQAHLSGTLSEYLYLSPAYVIKQATAEWAKEHGISYIHYGGGTDNDENNSLYQFKAKFGKHTKLDFYIGKKIWNEKIYLELCEKVGANEDIKFFPAYRGI